MPNNTPNNGNINVVSSLTSLAIVTPVTVARAKKTVDEWYNKTGELPEAGVELFVDDSDGGLAKVSIFAGLSHGEIITCESACPNTNAQNVWGHVIVQSRQPGELCYWQIPGKNLRYLPPGWVEPASKNELTIPETNGVSPTCRFCGQSTIPLGPMGRAMYCPKCKK